MKGILEAILVILMLAAPAGQRRTETDAGGFITLAPLTYDAWRETLAGYRGAIVVVDHWATWCAPCMERFPNMVRLYGKYHSRGVRFVSICLDDRDDPDAIRRAEEFLVRQKATFDNYRMDEIVPDAFEKLDLLGIPAVLIYDRSGKLRYKLTGDDPDHQFTDEDVEKAIRQLLGE